MKNLFNTCSVATFAKTGLFVFSLFWIQACSDSPAPNAASGSASSVLTDSSAVLGSSPNYAYRLFKSTRQREGQTVIELKLLRLQDLHEVLVSVLPAVALATDAMAHAGPEVTIPTIGSAEDSTKAGTGTPANAAPKEPKSFWSVDSKYLLVDNYTPDSLYKSEVLLFDLQNLAVVQRYPGQLLAHDNKNDVVFYYRTTPMRQSICYFYLAKPQEESVRDLISVPIGKLPNVILLPEEKQARVKAYTIGDTPVNFALYYY